jgi:hypothetical protein
VPLAYQITGRHCGRHGYEVSGSGKFEFRTYFHVKCTAREGAIDRKCIISFDSFVGGLAGGANLARDVRTPIGTLIAEASLTPAKALLDHRQRRYAERLAGLPKDHWAKQIIPMTSSSTTETPWTQHMTHPKTAHPRRNWENALKTTSNKPSIRNMAWKVQLEQILQPEDELS